MHLYLHVPFCARRCVYCDFSIAVRKRVPVADFVRGVADELRIRGAGGDTLQTVYFGGGTPSRLGGEGVAQLLDVIRSRFTIADDAEVTLETNPDDVSADAARAWRAAGITRMSLGVQSFDPSVLQWMHRTHTANDVPRAMAAARNAGITDVSLDLIFAMPEAVTRDWERDLDAAIAAAPTHLSVYGLTVEPLTPLGRQTARGESVESPEDRWATEFSAAHHRLTAAGYEHYEVSNYARPGMRARHNSAYWEDRPFWGIGPAAHGFDGAARRWNTEAYAAWLAEVSAGEDPVGGVETLTVENRVAEQVYLGLRTDRGVVMQPGDDETVAPWIAAGWAREDVRHDSRHLVLSAEGWMRLDALAATLTSARSRY
jgi:oxygen-independent coproporphyrinogen-3 oxidase